MLIEDIKFWLHVFDDNSTDVLNDFFQNERDKSKFSECLIRGLKIFNSKSDSKITSNQLFTILEIFCVSTDNVISCIDTIYPYANKFVNDYSDSDSYYDSESDSNDSDISKKRNVHEKLSKLHSILNDDFFCQDIL